MDSSLVNSRNQHPGPSQALSTPTLARCLCPLTSGLIVVHVDSLQLQVTVSMVTASGVDAMLIADDFPKLETEKEARDGLAS